MLQWRPKVAEWIGLQDPYIWHQNEKVLHSNRNHQQNENTTGRMEEDIGQSYTRERVDIQNI